MNALSLHRIAHKLYSMKVPFIPKIIQVMILFLFNCYVPYQTKIGRGTVFGHRGIGLVINSEAVIGENVLIRAHVTIGKKTSEGKAPVIEDNVVLGDGAKILGDIVIGEGAVIGANAVVVKDVPAGATAVGVPAKLLQA